MCRSFLGLLAGFVPIAVDAAVLIVDPNGDGDYADIQLAIDAARQGDTVLVKPGEYIIDEPINFNRLRVPPRPGGKNITLKSEGGAEVTTIRMSKAPAEPFHGSVVVFENGETRASIIDGFTLTGGTGDLNDGGGGLLCRSDSSPTVIACLIMNNYGTTGGGVGCLGSNTTPRFISCSITNNWAGTRGGGVSCSGASPAFLDCVISSNLGHEYGGGLYCYGSPSPALIDCTIAMNLVWKTEARVGRGGGVCCEERSNPNLTNCAIWGNAADEGGGVFCNACGAKMTNCIVFANQAYEDGGGLCLSCSNNGLTTFAKSCTIWGNSAGTNDNVFCGDVCFSTFVNSIVGRSTPDSQWCSFSSCLLDVDPLFVKNGVFDFERFAPGVFQGTLRDMPDFVVEMPDFHLRPQSPAIDAATGTEAPELDIEGTPRPQGAGFDIGAYEYVPPPFLRGDGNADGVRNIGDPICVLDYLFGAAGTSCKESVSRCLDAGDANDDGKVDIADAVMLLSHLFANSGPLPAPFPGCGIDGTIDQLGCETYPGCN